jgi:hypothetical protein
VPDSNPSSFWLAFASIRSDREGCTPLPPQYTGPRRYANLYIVCLSCSIANGQCAQGCSYTSHPPLIVAAPPLIVVASLDTLTYLADVYLMDVCLIGVHLTGVHLMGVHLIGVHLMGVHLIGMHLTGVSYGRVFH